MNSDTEEGSDDGRQHAADKNAAGASTTSTGGAKISDPVTIASTASISANEANKSTNLINFSPDKSASDGKSDSGGKSPIPSTSAGAAGKLVSDLSVNVLVPVTYGDTDMVSQIARGCDQINIVDNGPGGPPIQENIDLNMLEEENGFGAANDSSNNDSDVAFVAEYFYGTEEELLQVNEIKDEN